MKHEVIVLMNLDRPRAAVQRRYWLRLDEALDIAGLQVELQRETTVDGDSAAVLRFTCDGQSKQAPVRACTHFGTHAPLRLVPRAVAFVNDRPEAVLLEAQHTGEAPAVWPQRMQVAA